MQRFDFMLLMGSAGATYPTSPEEISSPEATDALIAHDITIAKQEERLARSQADSEPGIIRASAVAKEMWRIGFKTWLSGNGTPGVPPAWGRYLRACGCTELIDTIAPDVGVTYTLASIHSAHEWIDLRLAWGLENYLSYGARGNFELSLPAGQLPFVTWTMDGGYIEPTNSTMPVPDYEDQLPAIPVTSQNTPTFTVDGVGVCVNNFTYSPNNTIAHLDDAGCEKVFPLGGRAPSGQIVMRVPDDLDVFNAWAKSVEGSLDPVQVVHGPEGNRITVSLTGVELGTPEVVSVEGFKYWQINYTAAHPAGNPNVGSIVVS